MNKKYYSSPEFDYVKLHFEHLLAKVMDSDPESSNQFIDDTDDGGE